MGRVRPEGGRAQFPCPLHTPAVSTVLDMGWNFLPRRLPVQPGLRDFGMPVSQRSVRHPGSTMRAGIVPYLHVSSTPAVSFLGDSFHSSLPGRLLIILKF